MVVLNFSSIRHDVYILNSIMQNIQCIIVSCTRIVPAQTFRCRPCTVVRIYICTHLYLLLFYVMYLLCVKECRTPPIRIPNPTQILCTIINIVPCVIFVPILCRKRDLFIYIFVRYFNDFFTVLINPCLVHRPFF